MHTSHVCPISTEVGPHRSHSYSIPSVWHTAAVQIFTTVHTNKSLDENKYGKKLAKLYKQTLAKPEVFAVHLVQ